ncbi:MAG: O-linked N-acetylglucosamine transferase family protein [Casimicrobiaceae bacterium]
MTLDLYREWLARGRAHQAGGRAIDALLCYRRALREAEDGADARFHLGEIARQLGNPADAIAQWRAAVQAAPRHVASLRALADACADTGAFDAALDAVDRVLALQPADARARALSTLLRAGRGEAPVGALEIALGAQATWPLALLAHVVERIGGPRSGASPQVLQRLLDLALASPVTQANEDALRLIALTLARTGEREPALVFTERYAQACRASHRNPMPLLWPQRTAGVALRAGWLRVAGDARADALQAGIADAFGTGQCEWSVLELGALPASPEAAGRAIATLDLDVLIDAGGVGHASGPLLALRPARRVWALDRADAPAVAGLADRVFASGADPIFGGSDFADAESGLFGELASLGREAASEAASHASAGELAAHWDAAVRAHQAGDTDLACAEYDWVLERQVDHAPARYLRAILERDRGAIDDALDGLRAAVAAAPEFDGARAGLANLLVDRGDAAGARALVREGLARSPRSAALWRALGGADLVQRDAAGAVAAFGEAIAREPDNAEAHYNQGVALQMRNDLAAAACAYQRALALRPDLVDAEFNLGVVFDQQGNVHAAIAAFTQTLARAPANVAAHKALAETLLAAGRVDAWASAFERFQRNCPDHPAVAAQALEVCAFRGDYPRLEACLDGLRRGRYTAGDEVEVLDALQQLIYLLHFFDVEPELIAGYERSHADLARRVYGAPWPLATPRRPGKLRVGYLSGDFRNHVMGKMMWEALRHHDRGQFEVFGYATTDARDAWTDRIRSAFARLDTVASLSDAEAARRIAQDDLDVLVDLSTHTKGSRPGILARKPARVQIAHVATAGATAMSTIDFKLTDRHADIDGSATPGVEPLLAMDGCVYPWRRVEPAPADLFRRDALGIAADAIVIGAFSNPLKLSRRCLALWRDVLVRIPRAVLAFSPVNPALRATYVRLATHAGIDGDRIVFIPQGRDDAENQARYRLVDFVLDSMPYGGVNGTIEALGMGVPVVTLVGSRHAERSSYSILVNLGVTGTIAHTAAEYMDIAARLAGDAQLMRSTREAIARGVAHSALTDMPSHTRNLERAYLSALAQRAPEALAMSEGDRQPDAQVWHAAPAWGGDGRPA